MQKSAFEDLVCICGNLDPCVCGLHCPEPFDRIGYSIAESEATSNATDVDKSHSES